LGKYGGNIWMISHACVVKSEREARLQQQQKQQKQQQQPEVLACWGYSLQHAAIAG
jgi:hypothetical protein